MKKIKCACGCGRLIDRFDKRGRIRKFSSLCFRVGRPLPRRVRKYLSKKSLEPKRLFLSIKNIKKVNKEIKLGIRKHPNWKGGFVTQRDDGYIQIMKKNHPNVNKSGYVMLHRLIMEAHIGRVLRNDEVVHHINKDVRDNRIENLELFKNGSEHQQHHYKTDKRNDKKGRFK